MYIVNPQYILSGQHIRKVGTEQFERALACIREGYGYITPHLLLLQLQFGTIDADEITGHIMEFDSHSIGQALDALIERGLQ